MLFTRRKFSFLIWKHAVFTHLFLKIKNCQKYMYIYVYNIWFLLSQSSKNLSLPKNKCKNITHIIQYTTLLSKLHTVFAQQLSMRTVLIASTGDAFSDLISHLLQTSTSSKTECIYSTLLINILFSKLCKLSSKQYHNMLTEYI